MTRAPVLILFAVSMASAVGQSRPESPAESRPARSLSVRRLSFPLKEYADAPSQVAFSPDGRFLAMIPRDRIMRIYSFPACELLHQERGDDGGGSDEQGTWPPTFSSRSDKLALVNGWTLSLLTRQSGKWGVSARHRLPFHPGTKFSREPIAWSFDDAVLMFAEWGEAYQLTPSTGAGRVVKCGGGRVVRVVDLGKVFGVTMAVDYGYDTALISREAVVETIRGIGVVACSGDGETWLVERADRTKSGDRLPKRKCLEIVNAIDRKTRATTAMLEADPFLGVLQASFSRDGTILVTSEGISTCAIRDGRSGEILYELKNYNVDRLVALAISPDGTHVVTMGELGHPYDDGVILWELTFGQTGR